jgi:hypothetical protein
MTVKEYSSAADGALENLITEKEKRMPTPAAFALKKIPTIS